MTNLKTDWPKHPLFDGLSATYIDLLARTASEATYEQREMIFHEGESADRFHLIISGNVAVEVFAHERGPTTIQTVGAGEVLGWSWLVEPYCWHFDAQATLPIEAIVFDARRVRESFDEHPEFGFIMMKRFLPIVVRRLQGTRLQLLDVYHVNC